MSDARPVVLIDFSAIFRRCWHVSSEMSHAFQGTISGVNRAASSVPYALVAICCDGKGNWRKEISKEYKAQREAQPAAMYGEMDRTLDRLRKDGRLIWKQDGYEADDVIATACMMARTRGHEVRIVSHDKDLLQLLGPGVDFLAIHKDPWQVKTHLDVVDKYGVESTQFAEWLALVGDKSDNIKGCPGVGAKTATELLQKYGTIQGIYYAMTAACEVCNGEGVENAEEGVKPCLSCKGTKKKFDPVGTPNVCKNLEANYANVLESIKLVGLKRDVPINFEDIYQERTPQDIDKDEMSEIEKDADRAFGFREDTNQERAGSGESQAPEEPEERPEESSNGSDLTVKAKVEDADLKAAVSSPPDVRPNDKTPEEVALVSSPLQTEVIATAVEFSKELEPRSLKHADVYARMMFNSRVYSRYPTANAILAAVMRGREMGYGAGASLDIFHVADFNGDGNLRLMLHAHVIIERAMRDPALEYFRFVKGDATFATYEAKVKRNPEPTVHTYTIEDATLADLVKPTKWGKPSTWMKRPKEQLRKTAGVQLARIVAPWSAMGLYCPEELGVDYE